VQCLNNGLIMEHAFHLNLFERISVGLNENTEEFWSIETAQATLLMSLLIRKLDGRYKNSNHLNRTFRRRSIVYLDPSRCKERKCFADKHGDAKDDSRYRIHRHRFR
jgi:hypothetical protein